MGKVFKKAKKFVKKVHKKVKKITRKAEKALLPKFARRIADKIHKTGSSIWRGIKNKVIKPVLGVVGKVVNKLGPIGMIAMSFVIPGIGAALSGFWSSAATALGNTGVGWLQAVGKGMEWAATAAGNAGTFVSDNVDKVLGKVSESSLGQAVSDISGKITEGLKHIGGDISTGADNLFQSAKEFVGLPNTKGVTNVGQTVGQNAMKTAAQSTMDANPEFLKMAGGNITKAQKLMQEQNIFLREGQTAFIGETGNALNENPEFLKMAKGNINEAQKLAGKQVDFLGQSADAFAGIKPLAKKAAKSTLLKKLVSGAASSFGGEAAQQPGFVPFSANEIDAAATSSRFGIGGTGSAGGSFVDQSILEQIQAQSRRLEELG